MIGRNRVQYLRQEVKPSALESDHVYGIGPEKGPIHLAIVGEAPGKDEDHQKEPFVGKAGSLLNWGLGEAEIYRPQCWLTNVLTRRPPDNDINYVYAQETLYAQRDSFREEIRSLYRERGLKAVLALGATAMKAFGIEGKITKVRGSIYALDLDSWTVTDDIEGKNYIAVLPTYHPSYLARIRHYSKGPQSVDQATIWIDDLRKVKNLTKGTWKPPKEKFILEPDLTDIEAFLGEAIKEHKLLAIDIETTSLNSEYGQIVVIGIAVDEENALVIPFLGQYGSAVWSPEEQETIRLLLNAAFNQCPLLLQNAMFDIPYLRKKQYDIPDFAVRHDTLLLHHAISPELPHNLGFIVSQYGSTPYWKENFLTRETGILDMDPIEMRRYNARDCVVLHQVLSPMLEDLSEVGSKEVYEKESIPLIEVILQMQETGVKLSKGRLKKLKESLELQLQELEKKLRLLGNLPEPFNLDSDADIRLFLFGTTEKKHEKGREYEKKKQGTKVRKELYDQYCVLTGTEPLYRPKGFNGRKTGKSNRVSINQQGRLSYQRHLQNRLNLINDFKVSRETHIKEKEQIQKTLDWLATYNQYQKTKKILSTYTEYPVGTDGRIHTSFLIHGTATGRLSSRSPNLQNIPKKNGEIRKIFVAEKDFEILASDYENLEVKVLAYETLEPNLTEVVDSGTNIHDVNTRTLFHLTPDSPQWDIARRAAKIFMFGSLSYGGGDQEIYEKVILEVPELNLTFKEFVAAKQRYMEKNPVYAEWRDRITRQVQRQRFVTNAFGRTRYFYGSQRDIVKEALNFPIQSAAASVINRAAVSIYRILFLPECAQEEYEYLGKELTGKLDELRPIRTRFQAQIHDELRFEVHKEERTTISTVVKKLMEKPVSFRGVERTFQVDIEIGDDWSQLVELS